MTVGQRIKEARKIAKLTQRELAEKAGTATGTIQQYELGKRDIPTEVLIKLADYYGTSIDYLLGRTDVTTPYPNAH